MAKDREKSEVRRIRRKLGMTQQELASQMNVSVASIYRWEAGKVRPQPRHRRRLLDLIR